MIEPKRGPLADSRLLVVEDEALVAMMLEDMLEELGARVVGSVTAVDEIIFAVDETQPDAVTLDVNLMGDTSYPAAAILLERGIPFVFLTAHAEPLDGPPAMSEVPRVGKPIAQYALIAALQRVLTRDQPRND